MAYSTPYTFTALELLTAAKMNAIQTNISAIWVGTTAGDLGYYTSSTAATRLGIGSAYQFLQVNSGATAPAWSGLHFASVYHNTTQNVTTGVQTAITFNTETLDAQGWHDTGVNTNRITVGVTGYYVASTWLQYAATGGSGNYWDTVTFRVNGTDVFPHRQLQQVDAFSKMFVITSPIMAVTAAQYIDVTLEQNSGTTRAVQTNARLTVWRFA